MNASGQLCLGLNRTKLFLECVGEVIALGSKYGTSFSSPSSSEVSGAAAGEVPDVMLVDHHHHHYPRLLEEEEEESLLVGGVLMSSALSEVTIDQARVSLLTGLLARLLSAAGRCSVVRRHSTLPFPFPFQQCRRHSQQHQQRYGNVTSSDPLYPVWHLLESLYDSQIRNGCEKQSFEFCSLLADHEIEKNSFLSDLLNSPYCICGGGGGGAQKKHLPTGADCEAVTAAEERDGGDGDGGERATTTTGEDPRSFDGGVSLDAKRYLEDMKLAGMARSASLIFS